MVEDPKKLLTFIKESYKIFEFDPPSAKDYCMDDDVVDLFRDLHAEFAMKGFTKLPKGMQGLDSG